jgi:hypothetical protein
MEFWNFYLCEKKNRQLIFLLFIWLKSCQQKFITFSAINKLEERIFHGSWLNLLLLEKVFIFLYSQSWFTVLLRWIILPGYTFTCSVYLGFDKKKPWKRKKKLTFINDSMYFFYNLRRRAYYFWIIDVTFPKVYFLSTILHVDYLTELELKLFQKQGLQCGVFSVLFHYTLHNTPRVTTV